MIMLRFALFSVIFIASARSDQMPDNAIREVEFKNDEPNYNAMQISNSGPTLYVGTWGKKMVNASGDTVVECRRSSIANDHNRMYDTHVSVRTNLDDPMTPNRTLLLSHFFFINKEIWACHDTEKTIGFVRIVNELVGIKEILLLNYVNGITVSKKTLLDTARTAKIREIKYYDQETHNALTYRGKVRLIQEGKPQPSFNFISQVFNKERTGKGDGYFTEVEFATTELRTVHISAQTTGGSNNFRLGSFLRLPGRESKSIGNRTTSAICEKTQGSNPFPNQFRPECAEVIRRWDVDIAVPVTAQQFLDKFAVINEEIWLCTTNQNEKFYRVSSEVISTKPLNHLGYSVGLIRLETLGMDRKNDKKGIKFTDITYRSQETGQSIIYEGILRLQEQKQPLPKFSGNARIRDIQYALHSNRIYKSYVSGRGINIKAGTHWESVVGSVGDDVKCVTEINNQSIKFIDNYWTKFSVSVLENGIFYSEHIKREEFSDYFSHDHQEVWLCTSESNQEISFLRVVNEFRGLGQFYEIEYYDGIELYGYLLNDGRKSVRIFEIKYLHPRTLEVLKYEGKITLEPGKKFKESGEPRFASVGDAIVRSDEDIYWIVGSLEERFDLKYIVNARSVLPIKSEGNVLKVSFPDDDTQLQETSLTMECKQLKPGVEFETSINLEVHNETSNTLNLSVLSESKAAEMNYMTLISRDYWECDDFKGYTATRIVSDWRVILDHLKEIRCYTGVQLYFAKEPDNTITVHLREVVYKSSSGERIKYGGRVILEKPSEPRTSGTVVMSTLHKFNYKDLVLKHWTTYYHLENQKLYNVPGRNGKLMMKLGEKWEETLKDELAIVRCDKKSTTEQAPPKLSGGKVGDEGFEKYFEIKETHEWHCSDDQGLEFQRIVTNFIEKNGGGNPYFSYHDGFKVMEGYYTTEAERYFAFQEIRYINSKAKPIKYLGKLEPKEGEDFEDEYSYHLLGVSEKKVQYLLGDNEIYYMDIDGGDGGAVIEIGERYHKTVDTNHNWNVECQRVTEQTKPRDFQYRTRVAYNRMKDNEIHYEDMHYNMYSKFFSESEKELEGKTSFCRFTQDSSRAPFYKQETTLTIRADVRISRILFHDGIRIEKIDESIMIHETSFVSEEGINLKFEGTIQITSSADSTDGSLAVEVHTNSDSTIKEIDYALDQPRLHMKIVRSSGVALEIRSRWEELLSWQGEAPTCSLEPPEKFTDSYRIRVVIDSVGTTGTGETSHRSKEMDLAELKKYFKIWTQEVWKCSMGTEGYFILIINVLESKKGLISRIFHHDGVIVTTTTAFSGEGTFYVREMKYIDPTTSKILRYDGQIKFATTIDKNEGRQRSSKEDRTTPTAKEAAKSPERQQWEKTLRESAGQPIKAIAYTASGKHFYQVHNRVGASIEVGALWEEEFTSASGPLYCMLDHSPANPERLLTKVVVNQARFDYTLEKDTIGAFFNVTTTCWVCVNEKALILRVVTKLVNKTPINHVMHYDGVSVEKDDDLGGRITIEEIKYLDKNTYKQLKYVGQLESRDISEILKNPGFQKTDVVDVTHVRSVNLLTRDVEVM